MEEEKYTYHGVLDPLQNDGIEVLVDGVDEIQHRLIRETADCLDVKGGE